MGWIMAGQRARLPWPGRQGRKILPVFMPYLGCLGRCVFCRQTLQTGTAPAAGEKDLRALLQASESRLLAWSSPGQRMELAFYGGTFTAIPEWAWEMCLDWARSLRRRQLIRGFRCSTRPDAITVARLQDLQGAGCLLVELGCQSFSDAALVLAGRNYQQSDILAAIAALRTVGLPFGIQLLPGMPGVDAAVFQSDVEQALGLGPACLRYYPCLVLAGSGLARLWENGEYQPWSLAEAIRELGIAWARAMRAGIPVIRLGLAPQAGLDAAILAGPAHEALGGRVMGYGLLWTVRELLRGRLAEELWLPLVAQGYVWGWRREYARDWLRLGLPDGRIRYWEHACLEVAFAANAS